MTKKKRQMKILYCIAGTYRPAGMERVLAQKANWLSARGHEVHVATTDQRGRKPAFEMDGGIHLHDLGIDYELTNGGSFLRKAFRYPFKQLKHRIRLARLLKTVRPDITVSMFCNEAAFVPSIRDGSRKVLEVHFPRQKRLLYGRKGVWGLSDRIRSARETRIASRYDRFVVLTEEDRADWGPLPNLATIPNARTFHFDSPASLDSKTILAVGRYEHQKGFDLLLEAWGKASPELPGWTLRIAGDGQERPALERQAETLGVTGSVTFGKSASDIRDLYRSAAFLVLSSRYEGLPMALLEAQAAGLPAVAFACKCGPRDVIRDGEGLIVAPGDTDKLAEAMICLAKDLYLRVKMGFAAFAHSAEFSQNVVMDQWTELFEGLLSSRQ